MTQPDSLLDRYLGIPAKGPEEAVLQLLIELAAQVVGAEEGSLLVLDPTQDPPRELVFAMTVGTGSSVGALAGQRVPVGEGLTGLAALTHEVQIGAPTYAGVRQAERGDAVAGEPSAVIAAPMLIEDTLIGVITAVSFEPGRRFSLDDATLYARAASVAGVVVDQRRQLGTVREPSDPTEVGGEREGLERAILDAAARLAGASTPALQEIARVLAALEALNPRSER